MSDSIPKNKVAGSGGIAISSSVLPVYQFLEQVSLLLNQCRIYPADHPTVRRQIEHCFDSYEQAIEAEPAIVISVRDGHLYCHENLIDPRLEVKYIGQLIHALNVLRIGEIALKKGFSVDELATLMSLLKAATDNKVSKDVVSLWQDLPHVVIRQISLRNRNQPPADAEGLEITYTQVQTEVYREAKESMIEIVEGIRKIKSLKMNEAQVTALDIIDGMKRNSVAMLLMSSLKDHDPYTFTHSVNVSVLAVALAMSLDPKEIDLEEVGVAALLHDIGKLYIPVDVLLKEGELTPYEWQLVKQHPVDGAKIIKDLDDQKYDLARKVAFEHHMRWDRKGYPMPKPGYEIHPVSQMVRVVDSYDALTTVRPYRRQLTPYQAISVLKESRGSEYHPDYLDAFLHIMGRYPLGTVVRLNTDEIAMVLEVNRGDPDRPKVRVLEDRMSSDKNEGDVIDLAEKDPRTGKYLRSIVATLDRPVEKVDLSIYL